MHEQIRLSCQWDALYQTINAKFESNVQVDSIRAKELILCSHLRYVNQTEL